jgi:hypothetical protein
MRFFLLFCLVSVVLGTTAQAQMNAKAALIGFYNVENLYDTEDDPLVEDDEFMPTAAKKYTEERYRFKINQLATVISQMGTDITPDGLAILGLAEIENRRVIEDLVAHPLLAPRHYKIIQFDSPDRRGIDVAMIYQEKYFQPFHSRAIDMQQTDEENNPRYTRDILFVSGTLDGDTLHMFVNHWPSRRGGEARSRKYRNDAAAKAKIVIDSLVAKNPTAKIILTGDLNDDPVSPSVAKVLKAQRSIDKVKPGGLYNASWEPYLKGIGTLAYNDSWNLFDQMILSYGLVSKLPNGYYFYRKTIYNQPWMTQKEGAFKGYPWRTYVGDTWQGGYSDHFPVFVTLIKQL